jgi:hypothetical protein
VHAAIEIARDCARTGEEKTLLIGFSGHGHFDMGAYSAYLSGELARAPAAGGACVGVPTAAAARLYC